MIGHDKTGIFLAHLDRLGIPECRAPRPCIERCDTSDPGRDVRCPCAERAERVRRATQAIAADVRGEIVAVARDPWCAEEIYSADLFVWICECGARAPVNRRKFGIRLADPKGWMLVTLPALAAQTRVHAEAVPVCSEACATRALEARRGMDLIVPPTFRHLSCGYGPPPDEEPSP